MQGIGWFLAIILGAIAGWIAEKLMGADHGLLKNILLGIVGALLGNFVLTTLTDGTLTGIFGQLIVAVIGACILIAIGRLLRRG